MRSRSGVSWLGEIGHVVQDGDPNMWRYVLSVISRKRSPCLCFRHGLCPICDQLQEAVSRCADLKRGENEGNLKGSASLSCMLKKG